MWRRMKYWAKKVWSSTRVAFFKTKEPKKSRRSWSWGTSTASLATLTLITPTAKRWKDLRPTPILTFEVQLLSTVSLLGIKSSTAEEWREKNRIFHPCVCANKGRHFWWKLILKEDFFIEMIGLTCYCVIYFYFHQKSFEHRHLCNNSFVI